MKKKLLLQRDYAQREIINSLKINFKENLTAYRLSENLNRFHLISRSSETYFLIFIDSTL